MSQIDGKKLFCQVFVLLYNSYTD